VSTTTKQDQELVVFLNDVVRFSKPEVSDPEVEYVDGNDLVGWVRDNLSPGDVFDDDALEGWAMANGFVKPE